MTESTFSYTPMRTVMDGPARVLVAEDDDEIRTVICATLRDDGYDVTEAVDGSELVDWIAAMVEGQAQPFDVIVSDIQMPGFTALDVMAGLRRAVSRIPIILTTAYGDASTRLTARRLGARRVLDKPFDLSALRAAVAEALPER
jgi:two-component system response regulator (stage 0 sporulation protein F)